jgi:dihydrofolate reductase
MTAEDIQAAGMAGAKAIAEGEVFIATSLDGFIAREDGGIDWLSSPGGGEGGATDDHGYEAVFGAVDALVMGRSTYDVVRSFGVGWPIGTSPSLSLPAGLWMSHPNSRIGLKEWQARPEMWRKGSRPRGLYRLYVDGGKTIQGFLAADLIRRLVITQVPVLIGRGIPLFGPIPADIRLRHVETKAFESGMVQSEYAL